MKDFPLPKELLGMTLEEARKQYSIQVIEQDGKPIIHKADYHPNRIVVGVEGTKIVKLIGRG